MTHTFQARCVRGNRRTGALPRKENPDQAEIGFAGQFHAKKRCRSANGKDFRGHTRLPEAFRDLTYGYVSLSPYGTP